MVNVFANPTVIEIAIEDSETNEQEVLVYRFKNLKATERTRMLTLIENYQKFSDMAKMNEDQVMNSIDTGMINDFARVQHFAIELMKEKIISGSYYDVKTHGDFAEFIHSLDTEIQDELIFRYISRISGDDGKKLRVLENGIQTDSVAST